MGKQKYILRATAKNRSWGTDLYWAGNYVSTILQHRGVTIGWVSSLLIEQAKRMSEEQAKKVIEKQTPILKKTHTFSLIPAG
jgi:FMN-dependent NADH-azoreductase